MHVCWLIIIFKKIKDRFSVYVAVLLLLVIKF